MVVGAREYKQHPKLRYSTLDATEFAEALVEKLRFERDGVVVLVEGQDELQSPTRTAVFHTLGLLRNPSSEFYVQRKLTPMGPDDLFVFYFSGHGIRITEGEKFDEFLLPVEASKYNPKATAIPVGEVVDEVARLPCRHKVLFIDACRDEPAESTGAKSGSGAKGIGARSTVDREGLATFYSCDPTDRSYEIDSLKHGSFTYCLLQAIEHPEVNTLAELSDYLKSRVPQINADAEKEAQQPFVVPNPEDMLKLDLFKMMIEIAADDDDLVAIANDLCQKDLITLDWWMKLTKTLEDGTTPNLGLKKSLFRRFAEGKITFETFDSSWRLSDRVRSVPGAAPRISVGGQSPLASVPRNGDSS
jgi:uncharacterized caspase-like protein